MYANKGVLTGMLNVACCCNNQLFLCLQLSAPTQLVMGSKPFTGAVRNSPMVVFPKYNNYLLDRDKFDVNSRILVPLHLLGIKPLQQGKKNDVYAHWNDVYAHWNIQTENCVLNVGLNFNSDFCVLWYLKLWEQCCWRFRAGWIWCCIIWQDNSCNVLRDSNATFCGAKQLKKNCHAGKRWMLHTYGYCHLHHQWFKPVKMEKTLLENKIFKCHIYVFQPSVHQFLCSLNLIQGVPGGKDLTSGECSLGQTIPI